MSLWSEEEVFNADSGSASSSLGSLFPGDKRPGAAQPQPAYAYKAPKQPAAAAAATGTTSPSASKSTGQRSVLHYATVTAFRYDSNQQAHAEGKVGAAVMAGKGSATAQLLVYKGRTDVLSTTEITSAFSLTPQENNYATFYDNEKRAWSVQFQNAAEARAFLTHVAIAKFLVAGGRGLVSVEMHSPLKTGAPLTAGDTVALKYTVWLVSQETCALGAMLDSNAEKDSKFKMTLGERNKGLAGWHDGLLSMGGARKGSRRILILPPELAYGARGVEGSVPPNATLACEIEVALVKRSRTAEGGSAEGAESFATPPAAPAPAPQQAEDEHLKTMRKLASMGAQQVMASPSAPQSPGLKPAVQAAQVVQQTPQGGLENAVALYGGPPGQMPQAQYQYIQAQPQPQFIPQVQYVTSPQPAIQVQQPYPQAAMPYGAGSALSPAETVKMMMEEREFRTEVKNSLTNFQHKMEEMSKLVAEFKVPPGHGETGSVSGQLVIQTMQRLVDDNERQRRDLQDRMETIESLRRKVGEIQEKSQRFVEDSSRLLDSRDGANKMQIEELRSQLANLQSEKARVEVALAESAAAAAKQVAQIQASAKSLELSQDELRSTRDSLAKMAAEFEQAKELRQRAEERCGLAVSKSKEEVDARKEAEDRRDDLKKLLEEQRDAVTKQEKTIALLRSRAEDDLKHLEREKNEELESLRVQLGKTQALVSKYKSSTENAEELVAEAEKKWRAKAERMVKEAEEHATALAQDRVKKLEDQLRRDGMRREELEEQLSAASKAAILARASGGAGMTDEERKKMVAEWRSKTEAFVKDAMNTVYFTVAEHIQMTETYPGSAMLSKLKSTIKVTTGAILKTLAKESEPSAPVAVAATDAAVTVAPAEPAPVAEPAPKPSDVETVTPVAALPDVAPAVQVSEAVPPPAMTETAQQVVSEEGEKKEEPDLTEVAEQQKGREESVSFAETAAVTADAPAPPTPVGEPETAPVQDAAISTPEAPSASENTLASEVPPASLVPEPSAPSEKWDDVTTAAAVPVLKDLEERDFFADSKHDDVLSATASSLRTSLGASLPEQPPQLAQDAPSSDPLTQIPPVPQDPSLVDVLPLASEPPKQEQVEDAKTGQSSTPPPLPSLTEQEPHLSAEEPKSATPSAPKSPSRLFDLDDGDDHWDDAGDTDNVFGFLSSAKPKDDPTTPPKTHEPASDDHPVVVSPPPLPTSPEAPTTVTATEAPPTDPLIAVSDPLSF